MKFLTHIILLTALLPTLTQATDMTIDQFLAAVDEYNPDLQLAAHDLDLASLTKREALAGALPTIGASGSYNRNLKRNYLFLEMPAVDSLGHVANVSTSFPINKNNEYSFGVALNQTLFSFNVGLAIQAARQYTNLVDQVYDASRQGVFTWARKAFYSTLLLEEVLEITRAAVDNARDNLANMQSRFDQGLESEFALLQAEVRLQSLLPDVDRVERNLQLAYSNLGQLAGWSLDDEIQLVGSLEDLPEMPAMPELDDVLKQRPDYNALVWEAKMRQTGVKSAKAAAFPTLTGKFIYNYSSQSDDWVFDENRNNSWIAGLSLNIPIYTGGYISTQVQKTRVELRKNQLSIRQREHEIRTELENTRMLLEEAHGRIASARATRELAARAYRIAQDGAASGLVSQLELKDAGLNYDNAKIGYYSATLEYLNVWFDWKLALGEGDLGQ